MKPRAGSDSAARRLMTGRYLARNPAVVGVMAAGDAIGFLSSPRSGPLPNDRPLNVLFANQAHLGDLVNILPLLARLRAAKSVAKLGLVIGTWGRPVLELGEFADRIHVVDHCCLNRGELGWLAKVRRHAQTRAIAIEEMRHEAYDVAIDSYPFFGNSASLLWGVGPRVRIGFTSGGAGSFYTHRFAFDPKLSIAANQERLLAPLLGAEVACLEVPSVLQSMKPDGDARKLADSLADYVVLHIGPGYRHKDWPAPAWIDLGRRLIRDGLRLVYTGGADEAPHSERVRAALGGENLIGRLTLRGFATILSRAKGLVSINTVAGHLAACFHVPTAIVQHGTEPLNFWPPKQPFARIVMFPVPCAPCNRTHGCTSMTCIRSTSAETVYAALCDAMASRDAAPSDMR